MMLSEDNVIAELRAICASRGGATALAKRAGISQSYISQVLSGVSKPSERLFLALGWKKVVTWERSEPRGKFVEKSHAR